MRRVSKVFHLFLATGFWSSHSSPPCWRDVLVDVKEVVWVIGRLHCGEPLVVVGSTVVVVAGHEVDVAPAAARVGMDGSVVVPHPLGVGFVVGGVRPDPD